MSGGVDSSVAAAKLCRELGRENVVGVTLHLWDYPDEGESRGRCCAPEDIHDARRVCDVLGIPYYAFDRRDLFKREVVDPFVDSYLGGETPSPCVRCNRGVKIPELLSIAESLGAPRVATGHYARIAAVDGRLRLLRAVDDSKDQSYFLHSLGPETLARLVFPLGEATKREVRTEALELNLPGATKGESQELCFVPTGRYDVFVEARAEGRVIAGQIVDKAGSALSEHEGIHRFTVGQRRNLGVATGERAYVTAIDAETGVVRLGTREDLECQTAELFQTVLHPGVDLPLQCEVAVRYRGARHLGVVSHGRDGGLAVRFHAPATAVVPGQVAVFYRGDEVLGGGTIRGQNASSERRLPMLGASAG
jgi:tRNA-uridine 2-sulfurtransferase